MLRVIELVVALGLLFLLGFSFRSLVRGFTNRRKFRVQEKERVRVALTHALESDDYGKLDDWMILYGSTVGKEERQRIQERRDDLYICQEEKRKYKV